MPLETDLRRIVGADHVVAPPPGWALRDATEWQGLTGRAEALVRPGTPEDVAEVVGWCAARGVPVTPRGGGTGLAGGAVPAGGIVLSLDRLDRIRRLEPERRRAEVEAGVTTATLRRRARESGLVFGPDPGAAESSHVGGNVATNAGGPHSAGHGPVRRWVTALEVVLGTGELARLGAGLPRVSTGYDLAGLLCGSEGTLGIVTAASLRLEPAPEATHAVEAVYPDARAGGEAVLRVLEIGLRPAALDFLAIDGFTLLAEVAGTAAEVAAARPDLHEALAPGRLTERPAAELWRRRDGVSHAVAARRGGKVSDDIVVPVERLADAVAATVEIGARHGLPACSWGHAADGILHATFLVDRDDAGELERAAAAAEELFDLALALGGSLSGEHGLGRVKAHRAADALDAPALAAMRAVKAALDPAGILNPGVGPG